MEWQKIHDIAEELEHISNEDLIEKLDQYLGKPKIDPHGDPIPDEKGNITQVKQIALKDLPIKQNAIVSSVSNQTIAMMEMLNHYNIGIGSQIKVLKSFDLDGSLEIKLARKPECIISGIVAQNIFVYDN
jgi:DtxR family Mn-dependent transcriptional regulator